MTATRSGDILPVNNPSSPSPLVVLFARPLFATPSLRRFPRRGRETRRGGTTCKNPHVARRRKHVRGTVEPTPFTSSCRWIRGSPEMEDSTIREKLFDVGDSEFALGECVSPNVLFKRERDRSGSSKGFATQVVGGKDFNSLFLSLSFLIRVDRYGLAGSCKISQFLSSLLLVDGEEKRVTGFERRIGV